MARIGAINSFLSRQNLTLIVSAALVLVLVFALVLPWAYPTYDVEVNGFNSDYIYQNPSGGTLRLTPSSMVLEAPAFSRPSSILVTSQWSFLAQLDATILSESNDSQPLTVAVYAPEVPVNVTLRYLSSSHTISLDTTQTHLAILGSYSLARLSHISVSIDVRNSIKFRVSDSKQDQSYVLNGEEFRTLLLVGVRAVEVSSRGISSPGGQVVSVELQNMKLNIPHTQWIATKVSDSRLPILYSILAILASLLLAKMDVVGNSFKFAKNFLANVRSVPILIWILVAAGLATRIALFQIGRHPYDVFVESLWTRGIINGGLPEIYQGPSLATAAQAFNGTPYLSSSFPYPPFLTYFFYPVAGIHLASLGSVSIEDSIKLVSALSDALAAVLVFRIVERLGGERKLAIIGAGLYLFLPAAIYDSAVWGETDTFLMLMILATMYAFVAERDPLFWGLATLTVLTKQTAILPVLLLVSLFFFAKGPRRTLQGIGVSAAVSLIVIAPFLAAGYSPFILVSQIISTVSGFTIGNTPFGTPMSADAFSLLPLLSPLAGLIGRDRMWSSDAGFLPFLPISYSQLGTLLFALIAGPVAALFYQTRHLLTGKKSLAIVATLTLLSFFLPTRVSGRYFVIATGLMIPPFLAMGRKWMIGPITLISATTLISMHGLLTYLGEWIPNISMIDTSNPFNKAIESFYVSDFGITLCVLLNLTAVACSILALHSARSLITLKRALGMRRWMRF